MVIKEKMMYETSDGCTFKNREDANNWELSTELVKMLGLPGRYEPITVKQLIKHKDKLIQFFIDKGYVKKIEE